MTTGNSGQIAKTSECVLKLSAKYFVEKKALSGSIVIININSYASTTQGLLLHTIHGGIQYSIMVKDSFYPHANASHFPEKAKNYMLILEEKSELTRNILQLNKLPTWNPLAKAIVFYQVKRNEKGERTAIEFINVLREYKLFRTIIFIADEANGKVVSYTWRPYSEVNCGGKCNSVYILDICNDNEIIQYAAQQDMFPADLKGCPLVTYAVISEPYVMPPVGKLTNTTYDDAYEFEKGGEINLVKIITKFTNMSLIVRKSETGENWGNIFWNGSATGAYNVLRNNSADLVIGNIEVTRTIRKWFHPTVSYTQDEMTWCVPKAGQASTWNNLVIIFQWSTWVATIAGVIVMGIIFHYLYYTEHNGKVTKWPTNSLLMTLSMLLGWGAAFEPKSATFRILMFIWLCFSINMGISYESFLRSFLMHPRFEKQISSETDLIQSGMPFGGREIYRSYFETNNASSFYLFRKYNSTTFSEGVKRSAFGRNFAVVSSKRQAVYQDQKLGKGAPLIYCFPENNNMYKYGVVLLARQWFPMLDRFNNIIRSMSENGLIDKWNEELLIHKVSIEGASTIVPLGVPHLLGAFMFIGLMYGASVLVFLAELAFGQVCGLHSLLERANSITDFCLL
ncbi:putative ionotropic glutamate receptor 87a [Operophtera brumata]|uniref:Putative ionotropic glutamate receptor 87a n=1 Tax=Operophtera brumata TaxID=104452 RepID=A0A0L7KRH6_OPEBR|nr:putative ionotropic glutamate receptor 87a [Operophtera brumata]